MDAFFRCERMQEVQINGKTTGMNVSDQVREAVKNSEWPLSRIAEAVGMKTPPLWRFVNQDAGIRLDAFAKLCEFFQMSLTAPKDPQIPTGKEKRK